MDSVPPNRQIVPPVGSPTSRIAIVGEAPGADEVYQQEPFVGRAGELLNRSLHSAGIARQSCYITNVVKERPEKNDISKFIKFGTRNVVETDAFARYVSLLKDELSTVTSNVIVAVGNVALYALTGRRNILNWRGSILESTLLPSRKVIPIIHPAAALREFLYERLIIFDLRKVREESESPDIPLVERQYLLYPPYRDVIDYLSEANRQTHIAFDIEVLSGEVSCISFCYNPKQSISIPFISQGEDFYHIEEEVGIWKAIGSLLQNPKVVKIAHNAIFDTTFLYRKYNILTRPVLCTMVAQAIMSPDYPKGLDFLTSLYTKEPYYKADGKKYIKMGTVEENFFIYNAKDSAVCLESFNALYTELKKANMLEQYYRQVSILEPIMLMAERGIRMDIERLQTLYKEAEEKLLILREEVNKLVGYPINCNSPKQLSNYFYNERNYKPYIGKSGSYTTDDDALKRLSIKGDIVASKVREIRSLSKAQGTYYALAQPHPKGGYQGLDIDGRLRCSYNLVGTVTGRLSSSETIFGTGCLLGEAQVLTPSGWTRLDELEPVSTVMQWAPDGELSWCEAKLHVQDYNGTMIVAESNFHNTHYTADHRIPYITSKGRFCEIPAKDMSKSTMWKLPLSGHYSGKYCIPYPRLLVAVQADGSIEGKNIRLSFTKKRKIQRLLWLFELYGIEYTEQSARDGYRRFCISVEHSAPIIQMLRLEGPKTIGSWILQLDKYTLEEILDELQYWDATKRGSSFLYYNTDPVSIYWVQTLAHLCGKSATVYVNEDNNQGYGRGENKVLYTVAIKPRDYAYQEPKFFSTYHREGKVYCVTTETSYFLVKSGGVITVTGNTNLQNQPPEMKKCMLADPDHIMINIDKKTAEPRVVAYCGPVESMIRCFEEGRDIHTSTTSMLFGIPYDEVSNTPGSSPLGDGKKSQRYWGKMCNNAFNYGMGYVKFGLRCELPQNQAKSLHEGYHHIYPGVRQNYQGWIAQCIHLNRTLYSPPGNKRIFLDRMGNDLLEQAYAWLPQNTIAHNINEYGIMFIYRNKIPLKLLNQVHDSLLLEINYKEHTAAEIADYILALDESLRTPYTYRGRTFSLPNEFSIGWDAAAKRELPIENRTKLIEAIEEVISSKVGSV